MQTFNKMYGEIANMYLEKYKDRLILMDGFTFYNSYDTIFCLHLAPEYRLPNDVHELVSRNSGNFVKLHGYNIAVNLKLAPKWHNMRISNIDGNDMLDFYDGDIIPCSHCEINVNMHLHWFLHNHVLCSDCYENKLELSGLPKKGWIRVHDPEMNFLDYVEFMREPDENLICFGSVYFVNCNPASKNYGKIMVSACDSHGRQRFDILYHNVNHLICDILNWFTSVPSAFTSDELIKQYSYCDWFEMNPEDIPIDQNLEISRSDKHIEELFNNPIEGYLANRAIKYGIINKDEVLTNSIVLENAHRLCTVEDTNTELQKIILINTKHRERQSSNGIKGRQVGLSGGSKSISDMTDEEIVEISQKELQELLQTPIFSIYDVMKIYDSVKKSTVYKNPCYSAFTVWCRVRYDLGFDWG